MKSLEKAMADYEKAKEKMEASKARYEADLKRFKAAEIAKTEAENLEIVRIIRAMDMRCAERHPRPCCPDRHPWPGVLSEIFQKTQKTF